MNKKNFSTWVVLTVVVWMTLVAGVSCNQQKKSDNVEEEATEEEVTEDQLEALADVMSKYSIVNAFSDGLAVVSDKTTNLWGAINKEGEEVIPCTFQYIAEAFHEGVAIA
ncbi:WG repeat-containing protein, partial [Vibrio sp. FNV 38]|nr:WG repeat-containing protein [Vibrio sp. FNV 38]